MSITPPLECINFPDPRRNESVSAGEDKIIWSENMTGGFKGFVNRVSVSRGDNNLGNDNTYVDLIIDGILVERIKREISLNHPDKFDPPITVENSIKFIAHNGDATAHQFEVICQGILCRPKTV